MDALMQNINGSAQVYADFARILQYPDAGYALGINALAEGLQQTSPEAAKNLREFLKTASVLSLDELRESFTRAFDMAPQCIPYLSVYLFGEESYKRSELMTGLLEAYANAGYEIGNELPDHLSVVLGYAPYCSEGEWAELVHWCLPGPLGEMLRGLERAQNPYVHVLRALTHVFKTRFPQEFRHV